MIKTGDNPWDLKHFNKTLSDRNSAFNIFSKWMYNNEAAE